jgi:hypothetical protein
MRSDVPKIDSRGIENILRFYLYLVLLIFLFVFNVPLVESISSGDLVVFITNTTHNGNFTGDTSISEIAYNCTDLSGLKFADSTDEARLDLLITIPPAESTGIKSSTVMVTADMD